MTEQWTADEERKFVEASERRERVLAKRKEPVAKIARMLCTTNADYIFGYLISHADEIRDVLVPYDSGVRCTPEAGEKQ